MCFLLCDLLMTVCLSGHVAGCLGIRNFLTKKITWPNMWVQNLISITWFHRKFKRYIPINYAYHFLTFYYMWTFANCVIKNGIVWSIWTTASNKNVQVFSNTWEIVTYSVDVPIYLHRPPSAAWVVHPCYPIVFLMVRGNSWSNVQRFMLCLCALPSQVFGVPTRCKLKVCSLTNFTESVILTQWLVLLPVDWDTNGLLFTKPLSWIRI